MVIIEPGRPLNPDGELAERMLRRQQVMGLLSWVSMEHEGDMTFWYQITGMQSLTDRLQQRSLDHELLQEVLAVLLGLQEELPRYYLKPEHLLLRAEQIFVDTTGGQIKLCYEPMWSREPRESLRELLEQLLPQIDHSDRTAVALAYGLYEVCQQPNADVWKYVWEQSQEFEAGGQPPLPATELQETTGKAEAAPGNETDSPPEPAHVSTLRIPTDLTRYTPQITQFLQQLPQKYKKFRKKDKEYKTEPIYLFEPEEEVVASENPTVYLGAGAQAQGRLNYVGSGTQPGFQIEGDTFLIGGTHGHADGVIASSGISRSHARVTCVENVYYIEDLNSRNGTYLNGELLLYRQKRRLQPGDHLRFANEEYIFC